ncbi:MAG: carbohydrate kinase family protein [Bacteroidales bacterium]
MRKIYTIGETVYDLIFEDGNVKAGKAGGSMLNASVSLGRMGAEVHFISELGSDHLGDVIEGFLRQNGVGTGYISRFDEGHTPLALAFLDENKNARYTFYKDYPAERFRQDFPVVTGEDLVLFGSFFALSPAVRKPLTDFVRQAADAGALILYDPNIRRPHQMDLPYLLQMFNENLAFADITRASDEDFRVIAGLQSAEDAFAYLNEHTGSCLIYTSGGARVRMISRENDLEMLVPPVEVCSTVGAGDSFNAGLLWSLVDRQIYRSEIRKLSDAEWQSLIQTAITFGSHVCGDFDNYISTGFAQEMLIQNNQ